MWVDWAFCYFSLVFLKEKWEVIYCKQFVWGFFHLKHCLPGWEHSNWYFSQLNTVKLIGGDHRIASFSLTCMVVLSPSVCKAEDWCIDTTFWQSWWRSVHVLFIPQKTATFEAITYVYVFSLHTIFLLCEVCADCQKLCWLLVDF